MLLIRVLPPLCLLFVLLLAGVHGCIGCNVRHTNQGVHVCVRVYVYACVYMQASVLIASANDFESQPTTYAPRSENKYRLLQANCVRLSQVTPSSLSLKF
jgi:hypothetical protein